MGECACGVPSEANVFVEVVVGRVLFDDRAATGNPWEVGTETDTRDMFACAEHEPDPEDLVPEGWTLEESQRSQLR